MGSGISDYPGRIRFRDDQYMEMRDGWEIVGPRTRGGTGRCPNSLFRINRRRKRSLRAEIST